jgi:hypothetical protein
MEGKHTKPEFIQVGTMVLAVAHILLVDFSRDFETTVLLTNKKRYTFRGTEAVGLRKFFAAPVTPNTPWNGPAPTR